MEITICVKGKKFNKDSTDAIAEYIKRMSVFCNVNVKFYKKYTDFPLPSGPHCISYIIRPGKKSPSSPELATMINDLQTSGYSSIYYYIVDNDIEDADMPNFSTYHTLCLSCFSMHTSTTTIVLTEQLYRAFTILNNITYHK